MGLDVGGRYLRAVKVMVVTQEHPWGWLQASSITLTLPE